MAEEEFLSARAKFVLKLVAATGLAGTGAILTAAVGLEPGEMISLVQWLVIAATAGGAFFTQLNGLLTPPPPSTRMPKPPKPPKVILPLLLCGVLGGLLAWR